GRYAVVCQLIGLALAVVPRFFHGPIPYKFDIHRLRGEVAVWAWYLSRGLIGFLVGITRWPGRWWIRGPMCGLVMMAPLGCISLATPECGPACMFWNSVTAGLGGVPGGGGRALMTGRHRGP